jgi:hypothetical protein
MKRRSVISQAASEEAKTGQRCCDWPGCRAEAQHRAPRSRNELRAYRWFCLNHVRLYNASWNYYSGMSEFEVEADVRRDTVWQRPTWPMGATPHSRIRANAMFDGLGVFDGAAASPPPPPPVSKPRQEALDVMELQLPLTAACLKARYKQLVKIHHPDANGGDKAAEERFKQISEAYKILMEDLAS